ncbi:MAG: glycosyltransferase family 4 protein [Epulopiscium sp.]|nr:glycosyltransferase family 4 protein [Candidatus Epulonipiscium sp.]
MRIVIVTNEFVTEDNFDGGISNHFYRLALALKKMNYEPIIVVSSKENRVFYYNKIEVHRVKINKEVLNFFKMRTNDFFGNIPLWLYQSWCLNREVKKINKKKKILLVQYASYMATSLFRDPKIPSVSLVASYEPVLREKRGCENPTWSQRCLEWLEELALKRVDSLFAPSNVIANIVREKTKRNVRVIETPFMLDIKEYNEDLYNNRLKAKKYFLFFGSVAYLKGAKTIANMIYDFLSKNPDFYFVLIGKDIPYNNKSMVRQIIQKAGIYKNRVIYIKPIPHEKLYPIIRHAYAVVLPSRIDNLPNACIEAMALKKVVIGTDGTSFEQLITDKESGFLCKTDDPDDLLRVMNKVIALTSQEREQIGENAYARIQQLDPDIVVNSLVSLYKSVIRKKKLSYQK